MEYAAAQFRGGYLEPASNQNIYSGYVKVYRSLLKDDEFIDDPILLLVWLWILVHTAFRDRPYMAGKREIQLKRGQIFISIRQLSVKLKQSPKVIRRCLDTLEKGGRVERPRGTLLGTLLGTEKGTPLEAEKGTPGTLLTICNWDTYQSELEERGTPAGEEKGTEKGTGLGTEKGELIIYNKNTNLLDNQNLKESRKLSTDVAPQSESVKESPAQPPQPAAPSQPPARTTPKINPADVKACIEIWGKTLRELGTARDPRWDDYAISQLLLRYPVEQVKCALRGYAKEEGTDTFDPKKNVTIMRLATNPKIFDKCVSLGAEQIKRRILT